MAMRQLLVLVVLLVLLVLCSGGVAQAGPDIRIDFDDPALSFESVDDEYAAQGITFGGTLPAEVACEGGTQVIDFPADAGHSGTQVATVPSGETCSGGQATFDRLRTKVSVVARRNCCPTDTRPFVLTAYDSAGQEVASAQEVPTDTAWVTVTVTSATTNIKRFAFHGASSVFDDVVFDDPPVEPVVSPTPTPTPTPSPTPVPPDPEIPPTPQPPPLVADFDMYPEVVHSGDTVRFDGSVAALLSGGPLSTYSWRFDGRPILCDKEETLAVRVIKGGQHAIQLTVSDPFRGQFTTPPRTFLVKPDPVFVLPVRPPGRGLTPTFRPRARSAQGAIRVDCGPPPYDVSINGIEVTQGIQRRAPDYPGFELPSDPDPLKRYTVPYEGVRLAANSHTVVRVFADAVGGPVSGTRVVLRRGDRNGPALTPLYGLENLTDSGCRCVFGLARGDKKGAFTFLLPDDWTNAGSLALYAQAIPPGQQWNPARTGSRGPAECATELCKNNNRMILDGVRFENTPPVEVMPIAMRINGEAPLPREGEVFYGALAVFPGHERFVIRPYAGAVDSQRLTDITALVPTSRECERYLPQNNGGVDKFFNCKNDLYFNEVAKWRDANSGRADIVVGVNKQERGKGVKRPPHQWAKHPPFSLVHADVTYKSVAHELGHNLGREHAGTEAMCPGGEGVAWGNGDSGLLDGVGLDIRGRGGPEYPIKMAGQPGSEATYWDLMSYCAPNDRSSWTSARYWDDNLEALVDFGRRVGFGPRYPNSGRAVARAATEPVLHVEASIDAGGPRIEFVRPKAGSGVTADPSEYVLVAHDAAGAVLSETPMSADTGHSEPGPSFTRLSADVPAAGVASVAVRSGMDEIATRTRTAAAPKVSLVVPSVGTRLGTKPSVPVRWTASDADGDPLESSVDYSADGGRTWRTVSVGVTDGATTLPRSYFARSANARVRVRVNDGFNESAVTSEKLTSAGAPPVVRIEQPGARERVMGGAAVVLRGTAFDDSGRLLASRRLTWFDGRRKLGTGRAVTARGLAPGRHRLRLVANDALGRQASSTVVLTVGAGTPLFTTLQAPARIGRAARRVTIRVASSVPATLAVTDRRFKVGVRPRRITVRVPAGRAALSLRLTLQAAGKRTSSAVVVERS